MAKWKEIPSPEAIVRAALENAADKVSDMMYLLSLGTPEEGPFTKQDRVCKETREQASKAIRRLASDPSEVAAIISAAKQLNKAGDEINDRIEELEGKLDLSEGALDVASRSWGECQRILEQTEAKLATIVAIVRSHDTGDMQREDMEVRRILQRIEAELTGGKDA